MFTKTIFAVSALLSIAAAMPLQQQNKRDYAYETSTIMEVTTVDVTTTIWLNPGETPPAHYGHKGHNGHPHTKLTTTVPAASAAPVASSPPEQPSYQAPAPSAPVAPTTSAYAPPPPASQPPVPQPSAPAPQPSAPAPPSNPPSTGGGGGQSFSGQQATYYTPGMGSCGHTNTESDSIVALAADMMTAAMTDGNPNNNPLCGKSITITYGGKSVQATIMDTCPGCSDAWLDLTPSLFQQLAPLSTGRLFGVSWHYN